jgi:hypothetical protein
MSGVRRSSNLVNAESFNSYVDFNSLTPKSVPGGTKNSCSEGFLLAKLQAHKHPHHGESVSTSNGMGLVDPPNPT